MSEGFQMSEGFHARLPGVSRLYRLALKGWASCFPRLAYCLGFSISEWLARKIWASHYIWLAFFIGVSRP